MSAAAGSALLNAFRRTQDLASLRAADVVDVLVVGGGVTGTGVALDAASRGLSVALVERHDLAAGTSRWSSKLAHGGVRYITKGQVAVAWESAVERNRLATTIAPHLIRPMPFVMPMFDRLPPGARAGTRALFAVTDVLAKAARTPSSLPATHWADRQETASLIPMLVDVRGSYIHVDGALEDDARLVVTLARTAASYGAKIVTHCAAVDVARDGASVRDELTGERFDVRARSVVVAAGVWSGELVDSVPLRPSKGAHLVVRAEALGYPRAAVNVVLPGSINRFVFAVPRPDGTVLVGLTDDPVEEVVDVPAVSDEDERFLLEMLSSGLSRPLTSDDVLGRFAGLRPLLAGGDGGSSADLSRRHTLLDRDGVVVIVGGKLTTYRRMAQDAVDRVVSRTGNGGACRTALLPLVGAGARRPGPVARLDRRFGAEAAAVAAVDGAGALEPVAAGVPVLRCEVDWAVQAEGAIDVADILDQRLRLDLVPTWRAAASAYVEERLEISGSASR
ncbi:MAG TPA: glycerol-3-phosphate dehydrogenase/oxidase [Mycobacteriales bacterium]|nr:glycerol-3-phosphate dehydrogenase/oxidase [Mycobacteriales bacterium]